MPVMDHRNNAIANPDARKISDTKMRCLTKCLAMFGLGHYIYAGEDLPEQEPIEVKRNELTNKYQNIINGMQKAFNSDNLKKAADIWFELPEETKSELWVAPTKGGVFTTQEIQIMRSPEFRKAHYEEEECES